MNRFRYLLIFFFLISSHALHSQLRIEITEGIEDPIKIALVPIKWNIDLPQKHYFHEVMKQDLESFGEFNVLEPNGMLSLPYNEEEVFFRDWRLLGVDFLVIGEANRIEQSEEIVISYIIFDVIREKAIHRANIHGSIKSIRKISHNISDKIYSKVKGISGIFSTRLAYIDKPSSLDKNYNLRISDIDGFNDTILFSSSQPLMSPSWSPKGDRLAYVSFEEGTSRIFIQEIPTAKRRGLKLETGINSSPNWSPRGDKLAAVLSRDGNPNIYLYDLKKNTWKQVTDHFGIDTEPDWSPNGKSLVFTSNRAGSPQIYEVNLRTNRIKRKTFEGSYNARPRYLPDGKNIAFVHRRNGVFHIAIQNLKSGKIQILTDTYLDESPTVSPNGNVIIYATKSSDKDVLAGITINGRTKFILPSLRGEAREPSWSPLQD
mgnify:FL=1|tara:strand:+ start:21007 stop:22299 length:1293 start_codon:yes stop_codon:yes gene_type:complete